ncbi:MAG: hypothetical protein IJ774_09215 [Selenomonadaceae bacterium]|nr:hypothetical protein [Selenomonadaceae bacterium]
MDRELGRVGAKRYGGLFYEEFLPELRGIRGVRVYEEMSENDDVCGAILFAIKMLIRQASWSVQTASSREIDRQAAEFVESCLHDMQSTWTDTVSEILSFLAYGWSVHEIVYKRRMGQKKNPQLESKFDDGLIGWQKLPIRCQESLYEWEFDSHDNLTAFVQMPAPDFQIIRIPVEKLLLFRTESRKDNPEGRSILRNAYRSWYFKKRIQEIEGIGVERDLAGFPVLIAPEGIDIWSPQNAALLKTCNDFVSNIRRDALEGLTIPAGWELKLLSTGGSRQFDTSKIIERYDTRIAMTVLADFLFLGHEKSGSWALSSDKTELFSMAIGAYLDIICETFNRKAIPALIEINRKNFNGADYPQLVHGDIETQDLAKLGTFLKDMSGIGLITPDDELEEYLREQAGLPTKVDADV